MLIRVLKEAVSSIMMRRGVQDEYPLETERRLSELHGRAPVDRHLEALFHDARVGGESFLALHRRCLDRTGTGLTPFNVFQRHQTRLALVNYFLATLDVPGGRAECGAYRGATALLLCHAWRSRKADYRGADFFLIDSFAGASASGERDLIPVRDADGERRMEAFFPAGGGDTSPAEVRGFLAEFPEVTICAGWVPSVLHTLPERGWGFVRLDLTLYEPTLAALEYFYPRLNAGGAMLCDGSIFCPGAERAWEEFCTRRDLPYVLLGHRQYALLK
jgi:hypothetical protein